MKYIFLATLLVALTTALPILKAQPYPGLASSISSPGLLGGFGGGMPDLQISDDDMKAFYNYLQNLDEKDWEEIERMSKQMLNDMGFDPETLQPLGSPSTNQSFSPSSNALTIEQQKAPDPITEALTTSPTPASRVSSEQLNALLANTIDHLIVLRAKLSLAGSTAEPMQRWLTELGDLIYFLKVINKPKHHQRLISSEYENLRSVLENLYKAVATYEPLITTQEQNATLLDEPFEILGLTPQASQQEIDAKYQRLFEEQSPAAIEKQLASTDMPSSTKEKLIKEAALNFGFITDAYERIKDPKSRMLIESERQALQEAEQTALAANQRAINALAKSFTTLLQQEQLVMQLEQFLKKYEPLQLEERKRQEQATADRIKEQEALSRPRLPRKPLTIGQQRDWYGGYQPSYRPDYPGLRGGYMPGPASIPSSDSPTAPAGGLAGKSSLSGKKGFSGKPGTKANKPKDSKDKEKDQDSKDKNQLEAANLLGKKPSTQSAQKPGTSTTQANNKKSNLSPFEKFAYSIDDLDKNISTFNKKFDKEIFKQLQDHPVAPEEFVPFVQKFKEETGLEDIKSNVAQVKKAFNAADERTKKQYNTLWDKSGIQDKTKEFKKNINQTHKIIQTHSSSYQSAQEPIPEPDSPKNIIILERLGEAERLVKTIAKDIEDIEKQIQPKQDPLNKPKKTLIV